MPGHEGQRADANMPYEINDVDSALAGRSQTSRQQMRQDESGGGRFFRKWTLVGIQGKNLCSAQAMSIKEMVLRSCVGHRPHRHMTIGSDECFCKAERTLETNFAGHLLQGQ